MQISRVRILYFIIQHGVDDVNWMVSALASNVKLVIFDGAAIQSNTQSIWDLVKTYNITIFGCSASFIAASEKRQIELADKLSNESVRLILSTGSPLLEHQFDYYTNRLNIQFKLDLFLAELILFLVLHFATQCHQ